MASISLLYFNFITILIKLIGYYHIHNYLLGLIIFKVMIQHFNIKIYSFKQSIINYLVNMSQPLSIIIIIQEFVKLIHKYLKRIVTIINSLYIFIYKKNFDTIYQFN